MKKIPSSKIGNDEEYQKDSPDRVIVLRPHPFSVAPRVILACTLMAFTDYLAVIYPSTMVNLGTLSLFDFHLPIEVPILQFAWLALLLSAVHKLYDE